MYLFINLYAEIVRAVKLRSMSLWIIGKKIKASEPYLRLLRNLNVTPIHNCYSGILYRSVLLD